ncbi:hypothetical protein ENKNEFLB_04258 [Nocardioides aquaticus]|uniref:Uncharacterized protein n=1 Tax=Nocardioides aquaticus TaxID=160826 RepID=A0ABX8EMU0_9ACTN|nr:hypothetical protein [Nocardioides aquaticus]QVT81840.1 hypothetical protein ENKNEFLB_04258 [Nocardioides aquaticus]
MHEFRPLAEIEARQRSADRTTATRYARPGVPGTTRRRRGQPRIDTPSRQ